MSSYGSQSSSRYSSSSYSRNSSATQYCFPNNEAMPPISPEQENAIYMVHVDNVKTDPVNIRLPQNAINNVRTYLINNYFANLPTEMKPINMESQDAATKRKLSKKQLKKNSSAYLRQGEKANARKKKFLDKMTEEEIEIKRAKDRAYYRKKKAEKKVKNIAEMTEREKRKQRKIWKEASKKYREKKKTLSTILNNTPPHSDDELAASPSVRKTVGRKIVRKDRAKAYRKIKQQEKTIAKITRKYETLKKKLRRKENREQEKSQPPTTPNSKVDALIKNVDVPPEVRKNLLFNEVLTTQLKEKAGSLKKNSKENEVFQKCVSGDLVRKYKLLHMVKTFLPKERTSTSILKSDTKIREVVLKHDIRQKVEDFFQSDDISRMCPAKRDFVKKNGIKKQKRILLFPVKELMSKFVSETGINLSYTTLLRAKPFWVVSPKLRDRQTCLCVKHENYEFKLKKLKSLHQIAQGSVEKNIEKYSCDITSYDCMNGICDKFNNPTLEPTDNTDTVNYFQWKSVIEEKIVKGLNKKFKITKKTYNMSDLPFKLVDMTEGELYAELENIYSEMEQSRINGEEIPSDCESLASSRDDQESDTETTIRSNVLICSYSDSEDDIPLSTIAGKLQLASSASSVGRKSPVWSNVKTPTPPPDFTAHSGLADCVTNMTDPTPYKLFQLFFSDSLIESFVFETNLYAQQQFSKHKPTDVREIKTFLGLNLLMGIKRLPSYRDHWSRAPDLHDSYVSNLMSVKRFSWLLGNIHLNDNSLMAKKGEANYDKLYKVRPLLNRMSEAFGKCMLPSREVAIDESMIKFKGRSSLKQYMPKKPTKRGYKVWMLADKNGYCLKFDIYTGKPSGDVEKNLGSRIVKQLCEGLENKNHLVYFDNFFNGVELMEDLKNMQIHACGTVNSSRRNIPKFKSDKNMKRGDIEWFTSNSDLSVIKWKDKRSVFLLSNFHDPRDTLEVNRKEENGSITKVPCPKALSDYNANMNFVDKFDQNLTSYKIDRKSHKWWHRIFFFFLDAAVVNAFILYKELQLPTLSMKDFRRSIIQGLVVQQLKFDLKVHLINLNAVLDVGVLTVALKKNKTFTEINRNRAVVHI
ncbi:unnamed protein product [Acanthoscelides obtectus]|uniref:PiggyBac transposable element-derived protein domain-containing protein n=1 Tax=Acanthoscelides obtectus TaxID=200917 RepID=A0A9P0K8K2_ACAOB|nr:unnamed protein product [Acanthoscelides obtectus]CAK1643009.1 PiggyBac transposable element-derived protein 4 [Acanthoscelides obtectus]